MRRPWYRRIAPRYLALAVAGVVVLGAAAAALAISLTDEPGGSSRQARVTPPPLDPSTITVSVLNGTEVPNLAAQVADTVEEAGFQRGNVANATDRTAAESAVLFAEGAKRAARQVGEELGISQIEPIDPSTEGIGGNADVVVVVGADQAE